MVSRTRDIHLKMERVRCKMMTENTAVVRILIWYVTCCYAGREGEREGREGGRERERGERGRERGGERGERAGERGREGREGGRGRETERDER